MITHGMDAALGPRSGIMVAKQYGFSACANRIDRPMGLYSRLSVFRETGGRQLVLLDFSTFPLGSVPTTQPGGSFNG